MNLFNKKATEKLVRICIFEKYNYFGLSASQSNTWYFSVNDTQIVSITQENFLSIHKHSKFLLSQLVEDYRMAVPDVKQEFSYFFEKIRLNKSY